MSIEASKTQFFTGDVDMSSLGSSYPIQGSVHTISMHYAITDVANWFLSKESMTHKKLQKLCYYAQAWGLALFNLRITDSRFEAWVHGPVSPGLFQLYKEFYWHPIPRYTGVLAEFNEESLELLNSVWQRYKDCDGEELEQYTHQEQPWLEQRIGIAPEMPSSNVISENTMQKYYKAQYDAWQERC